MKGVWSMKLPVVLILLLLFLGCSPCLAGEVLKEDFEVNYNLAFAGDSEGDGGYFLYRFSYFAPFFLDSPGIAFQYEAGYKHTSIGLKKWDLLDYRLGLGFNCIFLIKTTGILPAIFFLTPPGVNLMRAGTPVTSSSSSPCLPATRSAGLLMGRGAITFPRTPVRRQGTGLPLDNTVQSYAVKYESLPPAWREKQ